MAEQRASGNPVILVIDDEAPVRDVIQAMLTHAGYEVLTADNGRTGMRVMATNRVDLVILDIVMPVQEGLETIQYLRRVTPRLPILAISGSGRRAVGEFLEAAGIFGATATLAKPFRAEQLRTMVADLLASRSGSA